MSIPFPFPTPLIPGRLIRRYKRFLADIELETGEQIVAHCPNTGPMTGVCVTGAPVQVSYHSEAKRKLPYTWELIWVDQTWVGINTALPNRVIQFGLEQEWFPELRGFESLKREVPYGIERSRIDFLLTYAQGPVYLEIKNTTWCQGPRALFPDTVTTRGQKHLRELMEIAASGQRAVILFLINRQDCAEFAPGEEKDPEYGQLLRRAVQGGVEVLPYRFSVDPEQGYRYLGRAELIL